MTYRSTIRKRKSRENETIEQREIRLAKDRVNKRIKKSSETLEVREARLSRERERKRNKRTSRVLENIDEHLNRQDENNIINQQLPESDRKLLQTFREAIKKLSHKFCPVCNERFPSIEITKGKCRRCYYDKNEIKRFSADNNMDPGEVPEELQGLTEIEEMLIARIFPIVSVYCLRGGQYAYRGNVLSLKKIKVLLRFLLQY